MLRTLVPGLAEVARIRAEMLEVKAAADFDPRYFHDEILRFRSVPLSVLEAALDDWISAGGPDPYASAKVDELVSGKP